MSFIQTMKAEITTLKFSSEDEAKIIFEQANYSAIKLINQFSENSRYKKKGSQKSSSRRRKSKQLIDDGINQYNLGNAYSAIINHILAITTDPENQDAKRNLCILLKRIGNTNEAELLIRDYLEKVPNSADGWNTLGTILIEQSRLEESSEAYRKAISLDPENSAPHSNLASIFHISGLIDPAFIYSSKAVSLNPDTPEFWLEHLTQSRRVCDFDRQRKINWWKVALKSDFSAIGQAFLQLLVGVDSDLEQKEMKKLQKHWASIAENRAIITNTLNTSTNLRKDSKINIGLISSDFKDHSVARFIWPLFKHINKERYALHCYSGENVNDRWQQRFIENSTKFRDMSKKNDKDYILQIQQDDIDILFDLTGFTKGSKTNLFANRICKFQASWLGYPGSTGLRAMDFIFVDKYLKPDSDDLITESTLETRGSSVCFAGMEEVKVSDSLPEDIRGFITFGSLNNPYKFTEIMISNWAAIMKAVPKSRFLFVRREFQSYYLRQNIEKAFEKHGIKKSRLYFYNNREANRHYLDCYNEIDITLDTYPVTGGTTTVDSLWMGVPVVAKRGKNIHQRVSSAILSHAGRSAWISNTDEDYIKIAIKLAGDHDNRLENKRKLRQEIKTSDLCDEEKFVQDFCTAIDETISSAQPHSR